MAENFLHGVACAIVASRECLADTPGRVLLWSCLMTMITSLQDFKDHTADLGLLSTTVCLAKLNAGLGIYTVAQHQVNVNLLIAKTASSTKDLVSQVVRFLQGVHDDCAINMKPLETHVSASLVDHHTRRRRFVPARDHVKRVTLDGNYAECLNERIRIEAKIDAADVKHYKPLSTLCRDDEDDTTYWHRFPCGTLATLKNKLIPLIPPIDTPACIKDKTRVCKIIDSSLHPFLRALKPNTLGDTERVLRQDWIPLVMRRFCVQTAKASFGIHDDLILMVGSVPAFVRAMGDGTPASELTVMSTVMMAAVSKDCSDEMRGTMLTQALESFRDVASWSKWVKRSEFAYHCIATSPPHILRDMCVRFPPLREALNYYLMVRMNDGWTSDDKRKAQLFVDSPLPLPHESDVHAEWRRIDRLAHCTATWEKETPTSSPAPSKKKRGKQARPLLRAASACPPCLEAPPAPTPAPVAPPTHHGLVERMRVHYDLDCELIGSGIFFDTGDVDVVVRVRDAGSLEEAYETVIARTGWTPSYDRVTGDHVAVLEGVFEGIPLDAQVYREGVSLSRAEFETHRALCLARTLECQTDEKHREHVRALHAWFVCAKVKGHRLCRLPGVGVTCAAIVLSCRETGDLLGRLRDALSHETPCIDFDQCDEPATQGVRCTTPLAVLVERSNVATRMTRSTTRHLLDAVALAISMPLEQRRDAAVYDAWRAREMVECARVRPRDARALSLTLHQVASKLDGHPLIDTLHFDMDDGAVRVLATLRGDADVTRYGFRDGDRVEAEEGRARASRGLRSWPLAAYRCGPTVAWERRASVCDRIRVGALVVPNAPHLRVDVLAHFDPRHWEAEA